MRTISMLVDNEPGIIARIAGLLRARGLSIESLCVGETIDPIISGITLVTSGEDWIIDQTVERLRHMINVIRVQDLTEINHLEREMVLVRVEATPESRAEILRMADIFRAELIDANSKTYALELAGDRKKVTAFLELLKPMGIKDIARTGTVAMAREAQNHKQIRKKAYG